MTESRRRSPGDRPGRADPRPPRRERRRGDAVAASWRTRSCRSRRPRACCARSSATGSRSAAAAAASGPGPVLVEYARRDSSVGDLAALAWPFLERLGQTTGETTNVGDPDARRRRPGRPGRQQPPARRGQLGRQQDPDPRVVDGKGVHGLRRRPAAFRPSRQARAEHDHRPGRVCSPSSNRCRAVGYATTWEELDAGLCSTAAPVRGSRGTVIAAISVSAPTVRTSRERLAELAGAGRPRGERPV